MILRVQLRIPYTAHESCTSLWPDIDVGGPDVDRFTRHASIPSLWPSETSTLNVDSKTTSRTNLI